MNTMMRDEDVKVSIKHLIVLFIGLFVAICVLPTMLKGCMPPPGNNGPRIVAPFPIDRR